LKKRKTQENIIDWLLENQQFKNLKLLLMLLLVRYKDALATIHPKFISTQSDTIELLAKKVYHAKRSTQIDELKLDTNDIMSVVYCDSKTDYNEKVRTIRTRNNFVKQLNEFTQGTNSDNTKVPLKNVTNINDDELSDSGQNSKYQSFTHYPTSRYKTNHTHNHHYFKSRFQSYTNNSQRDKFFGRIHSFDTETNIGITKGLIEYYYRPTNSYKTIAFFIEDVINRHVYIKKFTNCEFYVEGNYAKQIFICI